MKVWCAASEAEYLQGLFLPFLQGLPAQLWLVLVSAQSRLIVTGFAPGVAVSAPPELE